jgi:hypothetical protein
LSSRRKLTRPEKCAREIDIHECGRCSAKTIKLRLRRCQVLDERYPYKRAGSQCLWAAKRSRVDASSYKVSANVSGARKETTGTAV